MIEWRRVPWPLWVFAAATLWSTARLEIRVDQPIVVMVLFPIVMLAWLYFLFRGVRWVWHVTVAIFVLGFAFECVTGSLRWWGTAISLVELVLLLLPVTRSYFSNDPARRSEKDPLI